jgi:GMC oxidoreductase
MQKARSPCAIPACYVRCSFPYLGGNCEQVNDPPNPYLLARATVSFIMIAWISASWLAQICQRMRAKMGHDPMSVVDDHLQVYGIGNLCIADGSIMPRVTTGYHRGALCRHRRTRRRVDKGRSSNMTGTCAAKNDSASSRIHLQGDTASKEPRESPWGLPS